MYDIIFTQNLLLHKCSIQVPVSIFSAIVHYVSSETPTFLKVCLSPAEHHTCNRDIDGDSPQLLQCHC